METLVLDASVVIKWVYSEELSQIAQSMRGQFRFMAPQLILAESANILWKKVTRREMNPDEAVLSAQLLARADVELVALTNLTETATRLAIEIGHPAYDCFYLALCLDRNLRMVTADDKLARKLAQSKSDRIPRVVPLREMARD
jgi:predicted nucleic acid-binding protein